MKSRGYNHLTIEKKWKEQWREEKLFNTPVGKGEKMYLLFAFPYPSGSGLHVGHIESMTALDIMARYYRMKGRDVFFPMGWDSFGLPAENYAIKTGVVPQESIKKAINTFKRQIRDVGISYSWDHELATSHPGYYKWTQWIFLKLYEKGLAYRDHARVNWCPSCQTVLANEQVVNGLCERCDSKVEQRQMEQWFFKITEYADELLEGLESVDWPKATEAQQKNWIGRAKGAKVKFVLKGISDQEGERSVEVFTTRLDTLYGVTFMAVSPELAQEWIDDGWKPSGEVSSYLTKSFHKTEEERRKGEKEKTGVDTGLKAVNPANNTEVPVYVADYVLSEYGTGAVMGVPAHDERDMEFAKKYKLSIIEVIDDGIIVNSGEYNGMTSSDARKSMAEKISEVRQTTEYRLRDWLISRQRYWGAPIPIVYDPDGKEHPVRQEHLPWMLPTDVEFKPEGESPLKGSKGLKDRVEELYGEGWTPEYDTMDTFVDSSWYFLRYPDARNEEEIFSQKSVKAWLPPEFYMIGPEHIVLHLLYSRFLMKFLRDEGIVEFDEPFPKMRHQGIIMGPDGKRMSKSRGNVVSPDDVISQYGADTLRLYEMFMGPIDADKPWDISGVAGSRRFLERIYRLLICDSSEKGKGLSAGGLSSLHKTLKKVGGDIENLKFNTAIAAMMEMLNEIEKESLLDDQKKMLVLMIAPFAPFIAEEVWHDLGEKESVHLQSWPEYDEKYLVEDTVSIVVQVNGKLRHTMEVSVEDSQSEEIVVGRALVSEQVKKWVSGKPEKIVFVPGKLVNFVVVE